MKTLNLRTGSDIYVVIHIDESTAVRFPVTWWDAIKARLGLPHNKSKAFRAWHIQGIYSSEEKARAACEDENWLYFAMLLDVSYPHEPVEVQAIFPLRDEQAVRLRAV